MVFHMGLGLELFHYSEPSQGEHGVEGDSTLVPGYRTSSNLSYCLTLTTRVIHIFMHAQYVVSTRITYYIYDAKILPL